MRLSRVCLRILLPCRRSVRPRCRGVQTRGTLPRAPLHLTSAHDASPPGSIESGVVDYRELSMTDQRVARLGASHKRQGLVQDRCIVKLGFVLVPTQVTVRPGRRSPSHPERTCFRSSPRDDVGAARGGSRQAQKGSYRWAAPPQGWSTSGCRVRRSLWAFEHSRREPRRVTVDVVVTGVAEYGVCQHER